MSETYAEVSSSHEWRDPAWLWRLLVVGYMAAIALLITLGASEAFVLALYLGAAPLSESAAQTFSQIVEALNRLLPAVIVACAFVSLVLNYRLVANAHARKPATKLTGPVLAIAAYFIPLLSLFMPPLIMAELWRAAFGASGRQPNGAIALWWTAFLMSAFFGMLTMFADPMDWSDPGQAPRLLAISTASFATRVIAAGALLYIFGALVRQQREAPVTQPGSTDD
jgi:hypothetical protein